MRHAMYRFHCAISSEVRNKTFKHSVRGHSTKGFCRFSHLWQ